MSWICPVCNKKHYEKSYNCKCGYERCDPTICHSKCVRGCPCGFCKMNRDFHKEALKEIKKMNTRKQFLQKDTIVDQHERKLEVYIITSNRH